MLDEPVKTTPPSLGGLTLSSSSNLRIASSQNCVRVAVFIAGGTATCAYAMQEPCGHATPTASVGSRTRLARILRNSRVTRNRLYPEMANSNQARACEPHQRFSRFNEDWKNHTLNYLHQRLHQKTIPLDTNFCVLPNCGHRGALDPKKIGSCLACFEVATAIVSWTINHV